MISHEGWIRRIQTDSDLRARLSLRERMAHFDVARESLRDETELEFEYFLRRELRKSLYSEEPSAQVRRVIMHFAAARVRKQKTTASVSIRELVKSMLRRSESAHPRTLRLLAAGNSVLNLRSDSTSTRRIMI